MKEIYVCIGSACHVRGSYDVVNRFKALIKENNAEAKVELKGSFCMDACSNGVCVKYKDEVKNIVLEEVDTLFEEIMRD